MPTALELGREGWKPYLDASRPQITPPKLTAAERKERNYLLERIRKAADRLKKDYGTHRVILFGSLARESWFRADSDVDLAVEGLSPKDYWPAWRMIETIIADRMVDLIEIESAGEALREVIEKDGVEL